MILEITYHAIRPNNTILLLDRIWVLIADPAIAYSVKFTLQPIKENLNVLELHALRFRREIVVFITEIGKLATVHDTVVRLFDGFLVAFLLDKVKKNLFTVNLPLFLDMKLKGSILISKRKHS